MNRLDNGRKDVFNRHPLSRFMIGTLVAFTIGGLGQFVRANEPIGAENGTGGKPASLTSVPYQIRSLAVARAATDSRAEVWKPGQAGSTDEEPVLEISGLAPLADGRLAVAVRKGEVWILAGLDGAASGGADASDGSAATDATASGGAATPSIRQTSDSPRLRFQKFASALHDPMGLLEQDGALLTVQRSELTLLRDNTGDGVADEYRTLAAGWGLTGHYHEYAYGPKRDGDGNLWLTLNIGLGLSGEHLNRALTDQVLGYRQARWRGWGMMLRPDGELVPMAAGMRSPSGLGANLAGDMFYTDQQGNWVPTNSLNHLRAGAFFHHPESLASRGEPGSPLPTIDAIPDGVPYPVAVERLPAMRPPAVWFPYKKMGQSTTDIVVDASGGKFGPFAGQLFVGEFTQAAIQRVYLEQVDGEYQGACFPFLSGMASAVLRLAQAADGSLYAGLTNRGWSSLGHASHGLQQIVWTGNVPMEILEMRAKPDGFELVFTREVDPATAGDVDAYRLSSYTYLYQSAYGSDEIDTRTLTVRAAEVSDDRRRVRLRVAGLRPLYVHELQAVGVTSLDGEPLAHADAYYTLNRVPTAE